MRSLCRSATDPFDRDHYRPGHFTASGYVVSPDSSSVLMIFHRRLRRWLQPGGHVEPADPSALAAARREIREETGIEELDPGRTGLFDVDVHTIPESGVLPEHEHFDLRFLFRTLTMQCRHGSDAMDVRWVPTESLPDDRVRRKLIQIQRRTRARYSR